MYRIILPNKIDIVVASYGGVGSSFLLKYFKRYLKINDPSDADGLKHSPLPPISFNSNLKFVYIYGNPQKAVASLFRRNYHFGQSIKLNKWDKDRVHIPEEMTLQEYASRGVDRFGFENHFFNWYDKYLTGIPTLFVRYETIYDNMKSLFEFVGIPESKIAKFPKKKLRESEAIPSETETALDDMYGDFASKLDKLKDMEIRQNGPRKLFSEKYLDAQYRRALVKQGAYELKCLLNKKYAQKKSGFFSEQ